MRRNNYWTEEKIYKECSKYYKYYDLPAGILSAIRKRKGAKQEELITNIKKIIYERIPYEFFIKFDESICYERFLDCKTVEEFKQRHPEAYEYALKNELINTFIAKLSSSNKKIKYPRGYWNYENCKKEALKYKSIKEFRKLNLNCYSAIGRRGWYDELCSHLIGYAGHIKSDAWAYACIIYSSKLAKPCVYIGVTTDKKERFYGHRGHFRYHRSAVFQKLKQYDLSEKDVDIIFSDKTDVSSVRQLERNMIEKYSNLENIEILNKTAGGERIRISSWTPKRILEEAKKYETYTDFCTYSNRAAKASMQFKCNDTIKKYFENKKLNHCEQLTFEL